MMRRLGCFVVVGVLLITGRPGARAADAPPIVGFTVATTAAERAREAVLDRSIDAAGQRAWMLRMSARPHHIGTALDRANAQFIASLYTSWGYDTHIERFSALFPTPKRRILELVAPATFRAKLFEPPIAGDRTSAQSDRLPTYNAYSIDGDVTGALVYVNYGVPDDYTMLARHGVDVRGKIVIARYGGSWRGVKPLVAAQHGAIGCIIYSDPADDGFRAADEYPRGTARSPDSVQRGAVQDLPVRPGDPGLDKSVLTKIPTLPISANDARPLLAALGGAVVPSEWRGAEPLTYHFGGAGRARVHLAVAFNWTTAPLYDVIATMRGTDLPDEWVIRGNHFDAWVHGAEDPLAGQVAMLEEARAIGMLARAGSRPRRTIVFTSWDGEEEGLLGSTAWSTAHADELQRRAVVYINSDTNDRGVLSAGGAPVLTNVFNSVARDVVDPERHVTAYERARDEGLVNGTIKVANADADLTLDPLGSGSDFDSFNEHLGIEAIQLEYGGETVGQYHSNYDSFDAFTRLMDPGFAYGMLLAQTGGRLVLRMADADILPYRFTAFATDLQTYAKSLDDEIAKMRTDSAMRAKLVQLNAYSVASDPQNPERSFGDDGVVPPVDLTPITDAIARLQRSARACDDRLAVAPASAAPAVDALLRSTERALLDPNGLPRRPWRKNQITAPGHYTGYTAKTFPYAREAVEARNWDEARSGIVMIAAAIDRYTAIVEQITAALPATPSP